MRKILFKYRFWLLLALMFASQLAIVGGFFFVIVADRDAAQRQLIEQLLLQRAAPMLMLALLLVTAQGLALKALISRYLAPMARMAEEAVLLMSNPGYRIAPQGAREVRELGAKLNRLATSHQQLRDDVQAKIEAANEALAEERNRLAALMSELAQGVLVCNIEGRILLYNTRARKLFEAAQGSAASAASVGLGRSVFGLLERGLIIHALEQIQFQLQHPERAASPLSVFVTSLKAGQIIVRAQMVPVLDKARSLNGFVLTLDDITRKVEAEIRRERLQQLLTHETRDMLANIRAAVEIMQDFPELSEYKRQQFIGIIDNESQRLTGQIEDADRQRADDHGGQWRLEEMRGSDLLALLLRRLDNVVLEENCRDAGHGDDATLWLQVDSYALTHTLTYLAHRLTHEQAVPQIRIGLKRVGRLAHLELGWSGNALSVDTLHSWENESLQLSVGQADLTLSSVVASHGGEAVYQFDVSRSMSYLRILLPLAERHAPLEIGVLPPGRPEFYDFDLFRLSGQDAALDERPLTELHYTVFDTETTGLEPAAGDEIISIGAVRIVNGRLLEQEIFDQLVQPGQFLRPESTAIHGITDAMLKGRPRIDEVLPQFHRFAEDTVLVGHNAAFDMKFLQMKEARTNIRFSQPVLDTLLLSQVIHPNQEQHSLEALARRFGVDIVGRHTAVGDASVTAEVFLKMIPLLAEKGIVTLKQALDAAQQTAYARIRY
ncbi:exonuclease [Noviherbaspirillum autotrophicum]|uniref:DNA-directed DNA polymerase n=1 Tax=Noviherbaspirillum autotrophicum TaxID=709839 RepID=A0A0C2C069_9BURK|nr:exonuclease [Noviherbaspirillum autotrophicum]